jgi:hypothetical protein
VTFIATFPSSHAALAAERTLLGRDLPVELIPVPRQIHSDCGFCLRVAAGLEAAPALAAAGALGLWRVLEAPPASPLRPSASVRKEPAYERYA